MSVQIIVDSSVDVAERFREKLRIVPLIIHFGEEELIDGVTINKEQFYQRAGGERPAARHQPGLSHGLSEAL